MATILPDPQNQFVQCQTIYFVAYKNLADGDNEPASILYSTLSYQREKALKHLNLLECSGTTDEVYFLIQVDGGDLVAQARGRKGI